ncbi:hypothetical protein [Pedobacter cryoconitis]|uniref:Uncharacterized protein n=1 Tax=Pedobacter cryoconitis TaxID=188932 RepID=A0A7X0MJ13_9SPHI|nr:hypothetical protein [Pedobacter cryoconitis]MBB6498978.1 hypothetical protein [Pedobacter cryoconitis]
MTTGFFTLFQLIILIGLFGGKNSKPNFLRIILIGVLQIIMGVLFQDGITNNYMYYIFGGGYIAYGIFLMFYNKKKELREL